MSICPGDIRDQSRNLSEMAPNFGNFFTLTNFRGRLLEKFREDTAMSPDVIGANKLSLRPNFKFSRLNFWRTLSQLRSALASVLQSIARVKISGGSIPNCRNVISRKSSFGWVNIIPYIFTHYGDIRDQSRTLSELNRAKFWTFFRPPKF